MNRLQNQSPGKSWLRALELTSTIALNRSRILPAVIQEAANFLGEAPALLSDRESFSYRQLAGRSNRYARWALDQGVGKGDVVGLLMTNRPEYLAIWLGITSVGGAVALLNSNQAGPSLAHSINIASLGHLIVASDCIGSLSTALAGLTSSPSIWIEGADHENFRSIDPEIAQYSPEALSKDEHPPVDIEDRALYIYTSGTTGPPKAATVSHARIMQWSHWFAGMIGVGPADRLYNCLPMYHSVGGVQSAGAALVGGASVVIREKFSASRFWSDIVRWDCTLFQYIGELCRYLLHTTTSPDETRHRIRMACGNGLAPQIWEPFRDRFRIPRIFEFYASTEGGVSLFNVEGRTGAIGRIPAYLAHRFSPALVVFDFESGEPARTEQGFCIPCGPNETGEAIGKVSENPSHVGSRFEGYTNQKASDDKLLRNVFQSGDVWVRTGDLMRKDDKGFYYFVDRIGDTFRWKGENVATSEVADAISVFHGVKHVNVYGVSIPGAEGRAGMAALVIDPELDLACFHEHLTSRLPHYARPLFLRIRKDVELTGTFKYSKTDLVRQGYNPVTSSDALYFNSARSNAFVRLDEPLYKRIQSGEIRA